MSTGDFLMGVIERHAERWADAACIGMPTSMFFPERGDDPGPAKAVCRTCPVRQECLTAGGSSPGIWGGYTDIERRNMRRQRRAS